MVYNILILILAFLVYQFFKYYPEFLTFEYWGNENNLNRAAILRNIGLVFVGFFALTIAVWRALVATKELSNSKLKLSQEKLHKAVELLESESERNKISAFEMLSELIEESNNFDKIIFQISKSYLDEYANAKEDFIAYKDVSSEEKIKLWYSGKPQKYSISLCFNNYVKLIHENRVQYDLNQKVLFSNLNLYGLYLIKPNVFFQNCNLSGCIIYCDAHTKFNFCDLTGAIVIPYQNNTMIFDGCNISNIKIQVSDDISPDINGWHWKNNVPILCSYCNFFSSVEERRVVILSNNRVVNNDLKENYYNDEYGTSSPYDCGLFGDSLEYDTEKQKIINEVEYNNTVNNKD